jgi:uncharacterized protein YciI
MYLLIVTYSKAAEMVAPHIETHTAWVKQYFSDETFMAAGPKSEKNGGVILARSIDRERLNKILAEDSFVINGVANYEVIDFDFKLVSSELGALVAA